MASSAAVPPPEELLKQSTDLVVAAKGITLISNTADYENAINLGKALRSMNKGILEFWKPLVDGAYKAHKALCVRRDEMTKPVDGAIEVVDREISSYLRKEEIKRAESERVAREAALKAEQDRALSEAAHLSEIGQKEEAERVVNDAIAASAPPVVMPSSVPKIAGASQRQNWKYRIVDESKIPREYLVVDTVKLNQVVRALKHQAKIPGVEVYPESSVALRS